MRRPLNHERECDSNNKKRRETCYSRKEIKTDKIEKYREGTPGVQRHKWKQLNMT